MAIEPRSEPDGAAARSGPWWIRWNDRWDRPLPPNVVHHGHYYDGVQRSSRLLSRVADVVVVAVTAAIPVLVAVGASSIWSAVLGGVAALLTATRQVFRWQERWVESARTSVLIESEVVTYQSHLAPYSDGSRDERKLAAAVQAIVIAETGTWATRLAEDAARRDAKGDGED